MTPSKPRVRLPESAAVGEVIEIRALITHVMETGNRTDGEGRRVARNIIHTVTAHFEGDEVFKAELGPGISANPFLAFHMRVPGPGELRVAWHDDDGGITVERYTLKVE